MSTKQLKIYVDPIDCRLLSWYLHHLKLPYTLSSSVNRLIVDFTREIIIPELKMLDNLGTLDAKGKVLLEDFIRLVEVNELG